MTTITIPFAVTMLPTHKAGLSIDHNPHVVMHQTVMEYLSHMDDCDCQPLWQSDEAKQKAISTGDFWTLTWYPETPVGSCFIAAPVWAELIEFGLTFK